LPNVVGHPVQLPWCAAFQNLIDNAISTVISAPGGATSASAATQPLAVSVADNGLASTHSTLPPDFLRFSSGCTLMVTVTAASAWLCASVS
jgi:hypothetical protein